jgi:NAD(P)-dependent dehydrogenase (short-subunit alcohol dehydrogenase family)
MRERRSGQIIFVSSVLGRLAIPLIGGYAQSKWALEAIAETLSLEVGQLGIDVSTLEPAMVATNGPTAAVNQKDETADYARLWEQLGQMPSGLAITAEEVARAIADTIETSRPPLRSPVGGLAKNVLDARDSAPTDSPFDTLAAIRNAGR